MTAVTELTAWQALQAHYSEIKDLQMRDLFAADAKRFENFSLQLNDILFDFSKNRVTNETMQKLIALAEACNLDGWRQRLFSGQAINHTEQRAVMHLALRNRGAAEMHADGEPVMDEVKTELQRVIALAERIRNRQWRGCHDQPITDVVNIGIGGSHLGPQMATEALYPYALHDLRVHYVNNIDENQIQRVLSTLQAETTLFVIASKTFTTQETMLNAQTARQWLLQSMGTADLAKHMVAVTSNVAAAVDMGIDAENIFKMWDWVGGRYSMWSAIGLPIVIAIGGEQFEQLLEGAYEVDQHFLNSPLEQNIPVIMALLGIWYNNFFNAESMAVLPYDQNLHRFPAYLQQADMESNGKSVDRNGEAVSCSTGPVIFGEIGNAGQHAFYQLLHQGTKLVPMDLFASINNHRNIASHHRAMMSNVLAQAEAFMKGRSEAEVRAELQAEGKTPDEIERLLPYKVFAGNRPTNMFLYDRLTPKTLGSLIAFYEHKIFVQGVIWNLNSYDQWGVELGKKLASSILDELQDEQPVEAHDASTNGLINYYLSRRDD